MMKIALVGNPNSGKTTLFNQLTGSNQYIGNWPGVTVEKKTGKLKGHKDVEIIDLPGIYSLSPYSPEEIVTRDYIANEKPDVILNIVDGTNLERNLYLSLQILEFGIPTVIALNMADLVRKQGMEIDVRTLIHKLGCVVVEISALEGIGIEKAIRVAMLAGAAEHLPLSNARVSHMEKEFFSPSIESAISQIERYLENVPKGFRRYYAIKLFERDERIIERFNIDLKDIESAIRLCEEELGDEAQALIISERYDYIENILKECYIKEKQKKVISEKVDTILTNRFLALPIFAAIMFLVYYLAISTVGKLSSQWISNGILNGIVPNLQNYLESANCASWLVGVIAHGIVPGVGTVVAFVPQLFMLFLLLAFLEACGYISRIAFILDRIFRNFGLSGKSFIPILIGTGCSVPGIMSSRTIENEANRKITIITTSFMPCSAKIPIIALFAGILFNGAWWLAPLAYLIGIATIITSGVMLKKMKAFTSKPSPFIMELPAYHLPRISSVFSSSWDRTWSFIRKAGSVILIGSIFIWLTSNLNWKLQFVNMDSSILASIGNAIAWIFSPLGWGNWKPVVSSITGIIAKENLVGTFGILYSNWGELAANFTSPAALSFLVFNLLCAPCIAAEAAIAREMRSVKWFLFAIGFQTLLAYVVAMCVYQFWMLFGFGVVSVWTVTAFICVVLLLYYLFRKPHFSSN